jgi:hypothetical protein
MDGIGQGGPGKRRCAPERTPEATLEALSERITPELVGEVLRETGRGGRRVRRLPASAMVWLVIALGLFSSGDVPAIWRQVVGTLRMLRQAGLGRKPPAKSAFSSARKRLGPRPLRRLFTRTAGPIADASTPGAFYKGLRLMTIDAVSLDAPDTPENRAAFGGSTCRIAGRMLPGAYPRPTLCLLEEAGTHTICEALVRPFKCDEVAAGSALLKRVPPGSLVLWDRRYYARYLLGEAAQRGVHILGRLSSQPVFTPLRELSDGSILVRIEHIRPGRRHPPPMTARVIRYTPDDPLRTGHGEVHRLVTTLPDETLYPARELVELYHQRWEIEISNDEIKTHQLASSRPTGLRSLTPGNLVQEIYGLLLAYNGVRLLMHRAAQEQKLDPRRLSFTHAVRVVRDAAPLLRTAPAAQRPALLRALLRQIAGHTLPPRANRVNPRVVKRKMSHFLTKRPEHLHPPQPTKPFSETIVLLK